MLIWCITQLPSASIVAVPLVPSVVTANGSLLVRPSIASVTFKPAIAPASSLPVPVVSPAMVAASFTEFTSTVIS